jgi:hypothetical protein
MCQFPTGQVYSTTMVVLNLVRYGLSWYNVMVMDTGTSLYLVGWPEITPGALLRLYTTKINISTSYISRYSFINLYIIDTKFKFILSNIWISVQL